MSDPKANEGEPHKDPPPPKYEELVDPDEITAQERAADEEREHALEELAATVAELSALGLSERAVAFLTRE